MDLHLVERHKLLAGSYQDNRSSFIDGHDLQFVTDLNMYMLACIQLLNFEIL